MPPTQRKLATYRGPNGWGNSLPPTWPTPQRKKWHSPRYFSYRRSDYKVCVHSPIFLSSAPKGTEFRTVHRGWGLSSRQYWWCGSPCCLWWTRCPDYYNRYLCGQLVAHEETVLYLYRTQQKLDCGLSLFKWVLTFHHKNNYYSYVNVRYRCHHKRSFRK